MTTRSMVVWVDSCSWARLAAWRLMLRIMTAGEKVQRRQMRKERKAERKITSEVPQVALPDGMTTAQLAAHISGRQEAGQPTDVVRTAASNEPAGAKEVPVPSSATTEEERKEIAEMLAEENVVDLTQEDKEKLTELDALTGACPLHRPNND